MWWQMWRPDCHDVSISLFFWRWNPTIASEGQSGTRLSSLVIFTNTDWKPIWRTGTKANQNKGSQCLQHLSPLRPALLRVKSTDKIECVCRVQQGALILEASLNLVYRTLIFIFQTQFQKIALYSPLTKLSESAATFVTQKAHARVTHTHCPDLFPKRTEKH